LGVTTGIGISEVILPARIDGDVAAVAARYISAIRWENMHIFLLVLNVGNGMEWMGLGVAGMIITSDDGSFPKIPCV